MFRYYSNAPDKGYYFVLCFMSTIEDAPNTQEILEAFRQVTPVDREAAMTAWDDDNLQKHHPDMVTMVFHQKRGQGSYTPVLPVVDDDTQKCVNLVLSHQCVHPHQVIAAHINSAVALWPNGDCCDLRLVAQYMSGLGLSDDYEVIQPI